MMYMECEQMFRGGAILSGVALAFRRIFVFYLYRLLFRGLPREGFFVWKGMLRGVPGTLRCRENRVPGTLRCRELGELVFLGLFGFLCRGFGLGQKGTVCAEKRQKGTVLASALRLLRKTQKPSPFCLS
jgi:hypothetical protein